MASDGEVPRLNDLAREAGVGVGTVYRHFPTTAELAVALVEGELERFRALVEEAAVDPDLDRAVGRLLRESVALVVERPLVAKALLAAPAAVEAIEARIGSVLARARTAGAVRPDLTIDDVRRLACGIELAARAGPSPRAAAARYAEIIVAGVRPAAPKRRVATARKAR
ncbi:MAG: TetR family transcriptional regulator [Deltaproteobacteria bacterium]|nr:TetR family transcriptional regulator [Nannocystaceae bacterium]